MPRLTFGYLFDFRNPDQWKRDWHELYEETIALAAWTEEAGFDAAWVPEHHLAGDSYVTSPMIALAAMAARTRRIRLGSAIALAPLYHPVRFAEDCVALDAISGGRLEMALAIGYRRREYEAYGLDFTKRGARFDEFLEIATRLWAGETVDFEGRHFSLKGAQLMPPAPRGRIPLHIGGFAPKALERVARYADGYFGDIGAVAPYVEKLKELGKDPGSARALATCLFMVMAEDKDAAMEELAPYYHHVNNTYSEFMAEDQAIGMENAALKTMDLDAFKQSGILQIMTPDEAVAEFEAMKAKAPALEHLMLMRPPGLPAERFKAYAQVLADKVMPAFA
ncbi:LLM class flavin-dependent oxidoreductase [Novosphingobium sp. TH158]|uniref:LLM class flavin-dependent oxidoreductase n=1 Tax=Novosphingobium sp. TH158 TaxID=2067455 RepID=UPI000C7CC17F|nr:LLM class flavin-dependent oxidoreductase [Novosphingobium sp. TH158]PLK27664.1 LLM class flavin-dependent oxidoreductase [Novosphingobium sp. TH158]